MTLWSKLRFIYRAFKARFRDQPREIAALIDRLAPSDIAVDVGAHKGRYLFWLSRTVQAGKVVAFEPQTALADYLNDACASCGLANVTIQATAVSDRDGEMPLFIPGERDSPGASLEKAIAAREACRMVQVPVISLDHYFEKIPGRIGAIKIDVEGHELAVLRGAERILREHGPLLVLECESRHLSQGNVATVLNFLRERNYDGWFVLREQLKPIAEFREQLHQPQSGDRFWDSADYCNNFIMEKKR